MDLIAPASTREVAKVLRDASARRTRVGIVGGRTHAAKGNPIEVDRELSLDGFDRVVAFDPAEMLAVVEGGTRMGDLRARLAEGGQEWPVDTPDDATVGGGARTVKSVQGYDVHRLATGSLGTLGAIVRVAVKVRPLPRARRLVITAEGGVPAGRRLLEAVPLPASIVATPDHVEVALEGWPEEIEEQTEAIRGVADVADVREGGSTAGAEAAIDAPIVVEVAVSSSKLTAVLEGEPAYRALLGVGIAWVGLPDDGERLAALRGRVAEAGGIAPVIRGPGGLGDAPVAALEVHRRLKTAFDPANILAPGRFWGGL